MLLGVRKVTKASDFGVFVLEELCFEFLRSGKMLAARKMAAEFEERSSRFPVGKLKRDEMIHVFGRVPTVLAFHSDRYDSSVREKHGTERLQKKKERKFLTRHKSTVKEFYRRMRTVVDCPALLVDAMLDLSPPFDLDGELENVDVIYEALHKNPSQYEFSSIWMGLDELRHLKHKVQGTRYAFKVQEVVNMEEKMGYYDAVPMWDGFRTLASHQLVSLVLPKAVQRGVILDLEKVEQKEFVCPLLTKVFEDTCHQSSRECRNFCAVPFPRKGAFGGNIAERSFEGAWLGS